MRGLRYAWLPVLVLAGAAWAFDIDGSRVGPVHQTAPLAIDVLRCPTLLHGSGEWQFASGWSRLYNLPELDELYLAGGYRYRSIGLVAGLSQFGRADLYTEHTARVGLATWLGTVGGGVIWSYRRLAFENRYPSLDAWGIGLAVSARVGEVYLSGCADNINRPQFDGESVPVGRSGRVDGQYVSEREFTLKGSLRLEEGEAVRWSIGQSIDFSDQMTVIWELTSSPWIYGGGLQFHLQPSTFRYTVSYHPELGITHAVVVGVSSCRKSKAKE